MSAYEGISRNDGMISNLLAPRPSSYRTNTGRFDATRDRMFRLEVERRGGDVDLRA